MAQEGQVIAEGWIDTATAAELADYTEEYIRQLCRGERITAEKIGRTWFVNRDSLLEHKEGIKPGRPRVTEA